MLKRWRLSNFKSIRNEVDLTFAPITILSGLNSSGKSSILQSIRLMAQTLRNQSSDRALVLNGYDVQLGTFHSIVNSKSYRNPADEGILVAFEIDLPEASAFEVPSWVTSNETASVSHPLAFSISCESMFGEGLGRSSQRVEASRVRLLSSTIDIFSTQSFERLSGPSTSFNREASATEDRRLRVQITPLTKSSTDEISRALDSETNPFLFGRADANYAAELEVEGVPVRPDGRFLALVSHFLPQWILLLYGSAARRREEIERVLTLLLYFAPDDKFFEDSPYPLSIAGTLSSVTVPKSVISAIDDVTSNVAAYRIRHAANVGEVLEVFREMMADSGDGRPTSEIGSVVTNVILDFIAPLDSATADKLSIELFDGNQPAVALNEAVEKLTQFFVRNVRYLGPLRLEPHGSQSFSPSSEPDDVGSKGEFAAIVYESNRQRHINWWNPIEDKIQYGTLSSAVNTWLQYIGVAQSVSVRDSGVAGITWTIRISEEQFPQPLSAVGVGVSQVLPILIAGLLAPSNALLLIEQPELHLHPRAQARLADFFLSLTGTGRRCIVETHSEALVNQFRWLLARHADNAESPVAIYFSRLNHMGDTEFSQVELSRDGFIQNWPEGFMDENHLLEDRITREAIARRAMRQ